MKLHEIQRLFMDAMYETPKSDETSVSADTFIKPSSSLTANDRLAIYRGSVRGGLLQTLADIYPVLNKLLGDKPFEGLCRRYIDKNPSKSSNVADYGHNFSTFIESFAPLSDYPYFSNVASLEWAWHRVFHEADDSPLNFEQLGAMPPEQHLQLKFKRPKASCLLKSPWPIDQIWKSNQSKDTDTSNDETLELIQGEYCLLVWRNGYEMRIDRLSSSEWQFLNLLDQSTCFSEAVEEILLLSPNINVSELFTSAIQNGWIVDFESSDLIP